MCKHARSCLPVPRIIEAGRRFDIGVDQLAGVTANDGQWQPGYSGEAYAPGSSAAAAACLVSTLVRGAAQLAGLAVDDRLPSP